jgi:chemotaxis signal transduction protein
VAVIVDTVASVLPLSQDQIEGPPSLVQSGTGASAVLGIARSGQQVLVLLNISQLVDLESIHDFTDLSPFQGRTAAGE